MSREIKIQNLVKDKLQEFNIIPILVIFTYHGGYNDGMLSITTYLKEELDMILDFVEYKTQCDQSGYWINWETNTVIFTGIALIHLYSLL